jgi:RNA polymerase sigma factor (sigma-70 family)
MTSEPLAVDACAAMPAATVPTAVAASYQRRARQLWSYGRRLGLDPETAEERLALWQEVDRLPERQRAVLYLRYRADLEFAAIASILGITAGGARANCARALDRLRDWMDPR